MGGQSDGLHRQMTVYFFHGTVLGLPDHKQAGVRQHNYQATLLDLRSECTNSLHTTIVPTITRTQANTRTTNRTYTKICIQTRPARVSSGAVNWKIKGFQAMWSGAPASSRQSIDKSPLVKEEKAKLAAAKIACRLLGIALLIWPSSREMYCSQRASACNSKSFMKCVLALLVMASKAACAECSYILHQGIEAFVGLCYYCSFIGASQSCCSR